MKRFGLILLGCLFVCIGTMNPLRAQVRDENEEDGGDAPKERLLWFYGQRAYPNGIPSGARLKAIKKMREMKAALKHNNVFRTESNSTWQAVGPVNAGGRITALAYDASTPAIYIGAAEGGVWRGTAGNAGAWDWTPLTDTADAIAMGALALDPKNPNIIYAGTGEWSTQGWGAWYYDVGLYAGGGILKSTDAGATWTTVGLQSSAAFSRVIVNPDSSNIVYAAANNGLWRSKDAGSTWKAMIPDSAVSDIQLDPNDHTRLYVALENDGVYGMLDNTTSFIRLSGGFPAIDTGIGRIALCTSANGKSTVVDAVVATQNGWYKGIYKYNGSGWTALKQPSSTLFSNHQGDYDITIVANPTNPNQIIVGGVELWQTNNGGTSWSNYANVHADNHQTLFDPSGIVLDGCDGGIYLSQDNGASFDDISDGLAITQFYGIAVDPASGGNLLTGTQDNGSWYGNGQTWSQIAGGDGGDSKLDATNNDVYIQIIAPNHDVVKITLPGLSNQTLFDKNSYPNDRESWVMPFGLDKSTGTFYFGTDRIFRASNGTATAISNDLTRGSTLSTIGISPTNSSIIWSGSLDGLIYVTANGGSTWKNVSGQLPGRAVTRIVPVSDDIAYTTMSGFGPGHVMKTTDRGTTWTDLSANLPDIPVNALAIDPDIPTHLFIGTDIAVWFSIDDGGSWVPYIDGMPIVAVMDLTVQTGTKLMYAGTYGRSSWVAPMNAIPTRLGSPVYGPLWFTNQSYPIVWYGVQNATISYSTDSGATWITIDHNQSGPTYNWDVPSGINTTNAMIKIDNGSTQLISQIFNIRPPHTGDITYNTSRPFSPYGIVFDGNTLWSTSFFEKKIYKLDPDYLSVRDTIPSPMNLDSCTGITYAFDQTPPVLYVHRLKHDTQGRPQNMIYEIDTLGNVKNSFSSPVVYPTGLTYDGTALYAVDRDSVKIFSLDPSSGANEGGSHDPVGSVNGPRGLSFIRNSNQQFLHIVTLFNPNLSSTFMYRMQQNASGFVPTDTSLLVYEGNPINARGIEKDPRYPNTYWVTDLGSGTSGSIYRVIGFDVQSLNLSAPTTQSVWNSGSTQTISWTSVRIDSVVLDYSADNGGTWLPVAGPLDATLDQYAWLVPTIPTTNQAKIRVSATGANSVHATSASFTIQNGSTPALAITQPTTTSVWKGKSQHTISWSSSLIDSVKLEYTIDNGAHWLAIVGPIAAGSGQYVWTVPDTQSKQCEIRITGTGTNKLSATSPLFEIQSSSGVAERSVSPDGFELYQNFPNPFTPSTEITYVLPHDAHVTLKIFDEDGNLVRTIVDGTSSSGEQHATFDATKLTSGTYYYRLTSGSTELSRSMVLTK